MQAVTGTWYQVRNVFGALRGERLRAQLLRGGAGSIAIKVAHTFLALGSTILLARILGPEGFGTYGYVLALITLIAIPAKVGLPPLFVRETARAQAGEQWGLMRGLWRWGNAVVLLFSLFLVIAAAMITSLVAERFSSVQLTTFAWGLAVVPLIALGNLRGAALRGLRKVVQGQLPEHVLRPGLLILLLLATPLFWPSQTLTAAHAMALHVLAAAIAFAIGVWLLWRARPASVTQAVPTYQARNWLTSAMPLALISGLQLINSQTDIIMLGIFSNAGQVGIYKVVIQGGFLVSFTLTAVNTVIAAHIVHLYQAGEHAKLQRVVTWAARCIFLGTLPVALIFIVVGGQILSLVFGEVYGVGQTALAILCVGQLVSAAMGPVIFLLNMTGHEREAARGIAVAASLNILLNILLIPRFGIEGAATANCLTLVLWNILLWRTACRRLGIESSVFGKSSLMIAKL